MQNSGHLHVLWVDVGANQIAHRLLARHMCCAAMLLCIAAAATATTGRSVRLARALLTTFAAAAAAAGWRPSLRLTPASQQMCDASSRSPTVYR
jgi:hypothetical protein